MKIGLYDVDSSNFPNLPLMKISAYHKAKGDEVEFLQFMEHYDEVYVSKVFGDEYSQMDMTAINADKIIFGGTGFAITVENGKEIYHKKIIDIAVDIIQERLVARIKLHNGHAVLCECTRFIGADNSCSSHSLAGMQLSHKAILFEHTAHAECQAHCDTHGKTLRHSHNDKRYGNHH